MTGASCAGGPYTSLPSASTTRSGTTSTGTSRIIPCVPSVVSVRRQCSTGMSPSARTKESDDREHGSGPPPAGSPAYRGSPRGVGGHQGTATTDRDPEEIGRASCRERVCQYV